jgi:uncharacterized protein YbjQ (UPF0145 family)
MILSTTEEVPARVIKRHLGLVYGNTIRARNFGRDVAAFFKMLAGGEIADYTKMMAEAREQSLDRMIDEAAALGANAIIGVKFSTTSMMQGAAEILVYGTAVELE